MVRDWYLIQIYLTQRHLTQRILQFNVIYHQLYYKFTCYNREIFILFNFLYQNFAVYQDFKAIFDILALNLRDQVA